MTTLFPELDAPASSRGWIRCLSLWTCLNPVICMHYRSVRGQLAQTNLILD